MSDSSIVLNAGAGGDSLDAELIGSLKRERMQIGGAALAEIARVMNSTPAYNSYALAVRQAPAINEAGRYRFVSALRAVPATADNATSTGFFWIQNPVGNTKNCRVLQVRICQTTDQTIAADIPATPRVSYARFTFTGTASGAQLTCMKRHSTDAANSVTVRTAVTGMTVTLGAIGFAQPIPAVASFGTSHVVFQLFISDFVPVADDGYLADLAPGEGLVLYSADAGSGTARLAMGQGSFLEYTP